MKVRLLMLFCLTIHMLGADAQQQLSSSNPSMAQSPNLSYDAFFLEAMVQRQKGNNDAAFDLLQYCTQKVIRNDKTDEKNDR